MAEVKRCKKCGGEMLLERGPFNIKDINRYLEGDAYKCTDRDCKDYNILVPTEILADNVLKAVD